MAKAGASDPFDAANKPGEMSDSSANAGLLKQARIQKLQPGQLYVFRLTVYNPTGSMVGPISAPMMTQPGTPSRLREDVDVPTIEGSAAIMVSSATIPRVRVGLTRCGAAVFGVRIR